MFFWLFLFIGVFENSFNNCDKSYNDAEDNAILFDHNGKISSNYMLIKKVIAKSWFDLMYYNVAEK